MPCAAAELAEPGRLGDAKEDALRAEQIQFASVRHNLSLFVLGYGGVLEAFRDVLVSESMEAVLLSGCPG